MNSKRKLLTIATAILVGALVLSACGGDDSDGGDSGGSIKIGASLPLTGPLSGPFGPQLEAGYQNAVDAVNDDGGLDVGGDKRQVELVIRDNQSNPDTATQQARSLVLDDEVTALLGAATPPLTIPLSNVAESLRVPLVTAITPIRAWLGGNESGWNYAWDIFFDEEQMTDLQFQTADLTDTNKKVALFTDNEQDGIVMGGLWEQKAPEFGYEIASHAEFPVGTTDFSSFINDAKSAGAEVVIAQMVPPDAVALWKQMKSAGYQPKVAFCEKCANGASWSAELGETAEGTSAASWWTPSLGRPDTDAFVDEFQGQFGNTSDLATVVGGDTAAQVLMDAIARAGSTEPEAINEAIGETDGEYPFGDIKFTDEHYYAVPAVMTQWQGDAMLQVFPEEGASPLEAPAPGLGG